MLERREREGQARYKELVLTRDEITANIEAFEQEAAMLAAEAANDAAMAAAEAS